MGKIIKDTIHANGIDIGIYTQDFENEFISLTDIARYKSDDPTAVIQNWMRSRDVIEFLGLWERLHNPDFKHLEFEGLENRLAQMPLQCHRRNGLKRQMLLVSFQKQDAMAEHMLIAILPCLSQLGFLQSSSCIL
mgnify:CR=1 FL=1